MIQAAVAAIAVGCCAAVGQGRGAVRASGEGGQLREAVRRLPAVVRPPGLRRHSGVRQHANVLHVNGMQ